MTKRQKRTLFRIIASLVLFAAGWFLEDWFSAGAFLAAWLIAGYDVLWRAIRNILRGQFFDEKFLMSLATGCALAMQDWSEGAAVMIFFQIGELFEQLAVERSRVSIAGLMDLRPDYAMVLRDGAEIETAPEDVQIGDILLVRAGERIAVDGVVLEGAGTLDTSKITGESLPAEVGVGSAVVSGSVNISGVLKIRAESAYAHSTVARILTLVETASEKKASAERMITKFARHYTPCVILAAVLLAAIPPLFFAQPFQPWLTRALTFLVISCPCALVISVPLSFFSGMGAAAKLGMIVKGGVALEQLSRTDTVVFDKTGTLTQGSFSVKEIAPNGIAEAELLRVAALCEAYSNHPIANALRSACPSPAGTVADVQEQPGFGITATVDGKKAAAGNSKLMQSLGISVRETEAVGTSIYIAYDGAYLGSLTVGDTLRENAAQAITALRADGVKKTVMLTGDNFRSAQLYATACGIDEFHAQLLPQDKVHAIESLTKNAQGAVVFVGDGVNDAPVLTLADVGIAMGGVGSDAAVEAADVVILNDDIGKLPKLISLAKRTVTIARQNIVFALAVKGICLLLGALGIASMWLAVFADVGVAVLAILNSLRALHSKTK